MITQARLKELLHYNPDTGVFTWKVRTANRIQIGDEAGCRWAYERTHYLKLGIDGALYYAHRLAWLYIHGSLPKLQIDHIDGDGLNNRISNLRDVTSRENRRNGRLRSDNKSGTVGVHFDKARCKWHAQIKTGSGNKFLGQFDCIEDAISARKKGEIKYGFHKNHGKP